MSAANARATVLKSIVRQRTRLRTFLNVDILFFLLIISNLKHYRKEAGLSQAKLAELCDVSNGTIGNIECGVTKPSFDLLILMSRALNIQPDQLFQMKDKQVEIEKQPVTLTAIQVATLQNDLFHSIQDVLAKLKK